jgi:hypothetical protein
MEIVSIKSRKDGKFLVALHWSHGVNRRKVMDSGELERTRQRIDEDRARLAAYRAWASSLEKLEN